MEQSQIRLTNFMYTANPAPPNISKIVPDYQATNFTVSLEWTEENGVSYNVSIIPTAKMVVNRNNIWKLLIIGNYNISYNVSVIATLCDEFYSTTTIILEYGELHNSVHVRMIF